MAQVKLTGDGVGGVFFWWTGITVRVMIHPYTCHTPVFTCSLIGCGLCPSVLSEGGQV